MAKVCVIDVDRLSDKDLAGDSDFASFVNDIKKRQDVDLCGYLIKMSRKSPDFNPGMDRALFICM